MRVLALFTAIGILSLSGCGVPDGGDRKGAAAVSPAASSVALKLNAIVFPVGNELNFDGRVVRYEYIESAKGNLERYAIHSNNSMMSLEANTYQVLAKAGYLRRIRKEEPGTFVVNYVKKGAPTIIASFSEFLPKEPAMGARSKVIFTWKVPG